MLQTRRGTEDGFAVRQYREGEVYEVREHLARAFLAAGYAVREGIEHGTWDPATSAG